MNTNQDWKPIESAPKDGTPVLLFARLAGHNIHTNAPYSPTIQVGAYRTDLQIWTGAAYRDQREIEIEPVAWVPLPAFPGTAPEAPPLTVTVDPDARGVSVGVYQGSRCVYSGAHPIPASTVATEGEKGERVHKNGFGSVSFTLSDGFTVSCEWSPSEWGVSIPAKRLDRDVAFKEVLQEIGRLRAVASAPAAGDALKFLADTEGAIESLMLEGRNTLYRVWWPAVGEFQTEWYASPQEAVDAAIAAQQGKVGAA